MKKLRIEILVVCLLSMMAWSCTNEQQDTTPEEEQEAEEGPAGATVWNGAAITFSKAAGADPNEEANQDRITDNVWITRGNSGGQIYNAVTESGSNKDSSPAGTLWAVGSLSQVASLNFQPFRAAVGNPRGVVGTNLVMYIPEDNVIMSIRITEWSQNRQGAFTYERSTR